MLFTPALLLLSPNLHLGPHREFPTISGQREEKIQTWFTDGLHDTSQSGQLQPWSPSGISLKDSSEGKSPQCPWLFICLGGEMSRHVIINYKL